MKKLMVIIALTFPPTIFAQQSTGSVGFSGSVTTAGCSLNPVMPVELGSISNKHLEMAGAVGGWGTSEIEFVNCDVRNDENPEGRVAAVGLFIPAGLGTHVGSSLWGNTLGSATNVGINLKIDNISVLPQGMMTSLEKSDFTSEGNLTYTIYGQIESMGTATVGTVSTVINFVANYK